MLRNATSAHASVTGCDILRDDAHRLVLDAAQQPPVTRLTPPGSRSLPTPPGPAGCLLTRGAVRPVAWNHWGHSAPLLRFTSSLAHAGSACALSRARLPPGQSNQSKARNGGPIRMDPPAVRLPVDRVPAPTVNCRSGTAQKKSWNQSLSLPTIWFTPVGVAVPARLPAAAGCIIEAMATRPAPN